MGFEEVYVSLQRLFPQIDARALRAVSIEHCKDVDAAVVSVLEDIIPFFTERSTPNSPLSQSVSVSESSEGNSSMKTEVMAQVDNDDSVVIRSSEPFYDTCDGGHHEGMENTAELILSVESPVVIDEDGLENHKIEIPAGPRTEGTVSAADKYLEGSIINISCGSIPQPRVDMSHDLNMGVGQKMDFIQEKEDNADLSAHDISVHTSGSSLQLEETLGMHGINLDTATATSRKNISNVLGTEDESTLKSAVSSQILVTDVIEEAIADARNNKKTLLFEMESVINLMRQVEVKEQAAEQAKTEAETGGMDLLNQVEELKGMLQHAKETNDMHAGEVYGEKAILATELRELQSRVHSLSDERDVSFSILDEMRQTLEVRLSTAVNEIKSAEKRKLEKEEVARKSLAEQELIMEKVVEESKILRQQAEDNAKLEEFLLDRGRIVDALQGEIAVICQDVKLLKERFEQNIPLGKSLFSNQTSFILASLSSSWKGLVPDQVAVGDGDQSEPENNRDHEKVPEAEAAREDCNALVTDDGWELFDRSEVLEV